MSTQVQAVSIDQHGGPEVLRFVGVTVPDPAEGEVTIQHKAIGINYIDTYFRTGLYPAPLPHGLGSEAAGVVTAVGKKVRHLKVGDRVAYAQSPLGAYTELRNVPAHALVQLPDKISFDEAAAVMLKGLTVQYLLRQTYRLQGKETILFHAAAGGVGLIACQWAKALKVKLIGTVSSPAKAKLARAHGAWETINYTRENVAERVLALTRGKKVPVVYDGVGKTTWEASLDSVQARGLVVSFGNASGPVENVNLGILASKGSLFVTRPTLGTHIDTQKKLQAAADELFELILRKKIKPTIGQRYPLKDVARAHKDLQARKTTGSSILTLD